MTQARIKAGQYLALRTKISETTDNGELILRGVANDANETDSFGTRIKISQRGLDDFKANPVLLYSHNVSEPIGTVRDISYNNNKLEVEVAVLPGTKTPNGTDIQTLVRSGALNAFSIRFDDYKTRTVGDHVQVDAEVLDEVSLVSLPSNRASLITMRSKGVELHGAAEILKEAGPQPVDKRTMDTTRTTGPLSMALLTQRLHKLVSSLKGDGDYWSSAYLVAVYDEYIIWSEYYESTFYKQGYLVDAAGQVTLTGTEVEVLPSWMVVGAGDDNAERSKTPQIRAAERLHPDDLKAIVGQLRATTKPDPKPQLQPEPEPGGDEIPLAEDSPNCAAWSRPAHQPRQILKKSPSTMSAPRCADSSPKP